ncbi:conserved hypothetical protein [Haloferula helveola]|uniref:Uncharacterized protein n=1 Tax=Haloferula helveola TaxID=490095 RepID=A0ABN6H8R3_9BACT|nr:conserved hypothetical protein [Haloferula helveola]
MFRRLLLAGLALGSPLLAQENLFIQAPRPTHPKDKTRIEVEALFSMAPPTGYLPVRVSVVNQRKTNGQLNFDTLSSTGYDEAGSQLESEFTVGSDAGTARSTDLLIPLTTELDSTGGYGSTTVEVSMTGSFGGNRGSIPSNFHPEGPATLMSEVLYTPNSSALDAALNSTSGGYGSHSFAARFTPSKMPEDWRAYSGYDLMMLTPDDWRKMSPGATSSILQWIRLGGRMVFYASGSAPTFGALGIEGETKGNDLDYGFGKVSISTISGPTALNANDTVRRFHRAGATKIRGLNECISEDFSVRWPLHEEFGKQTFDYAIFVVVLIAFGVLVGPINLFVFAKSGKRHKLFITTPVISLATSALLIALILLRDGVGGRGARIALIEVRPEAGENRAYVLQEQISRTGVLLGGGFQVDEDVAITPVPIADSPWARLTPRTGGGGMRYTASFGDEGLKVTGDWFQSRSEQGQLARAVVPTRGRIELKGETGPPNFVSTFDFPIERLYYADRSGGWWMASDLKAGSPTQGTPISEADYNKAIGDQGMLLAARHRSQLDRCAERSGHYVAIASEAPAIETFDSIRWSDTHTILTGPAVR